MADCISNAPSSDQTTTPATLVFCQLVNPIGDCIGPVTRLQLCSTHEDILLLYETIVDQTSDQVCFFVDDQPINQTIANVLSHDTLEKVVEIRVEPLKKSERTDPVCRCTSTLSGHQECILVVRFNSESSRLATGGGDGDVRIWDMTCDTPIHTFTGNGGWITCLCWSADSEKVVSGCRRGTVSEWSISSGTSLNMEKHCPNWVSCVIYSPNGREIASGSKDKTIKIWANGKNRITLAGHNGPVTSILWPKNNWIVSGSHDKSIRLWNIENGHLIHKVEHAHWVNFLCFYKHLIASASDDFTVGLWDLSSDEPKFIRLTGHCQPVVHVRFSPDGSILASASFDKSVKLWTSTGKFICNLLGHVGRVYQLAWSPDSRYLVSASADSTVKLWSVKSKKLRVDLPGHADEVYALDWSKDGHIVATGGKDKNLKLWRR